MRQAATEWTRQLVDLGGRNNLLWFRDHPHSSVELSAAHPSGVARLMSGHPARLTDILREDHALEEGRVRVRAIAAKARELQEEWGLQAAFVGFGMATWTLPGTEAARGPAAPIFLRSVTLKPLGPALSDFVIDLGDDVELNPVLVHYLRSQAKIGIDEAAIEALARSASGFDPYPAYAALTTQCAALLGFTITPRIVLSTFSYAKLPMVADLAAQGAQLADHDIIAALAGDPTALADRTEPTPQQAPLAIREEQIRPDFLVLDADSAQHEVIERVRAGGHVVVHSPPGTGSSQTIANLLATLAGDGRRVLFVSQKRAALEAVLRRLDGVGLSDVVFDVHDGARAHRRIIGQAVETLDAPQPRPPAPQSVRDRRDAAQATLDAHARAMHDVRPPFGVSAAQVLEQVSAMAHGPTPPRTRVRFRGAMLAGLDRPTFERHRDELVRLAQLQAWVRPVAPTDEPRMPDATVEPHVTDAAGMPPTSGMPPGPAHSDSPESAPDGDPWFGARIGTVEDAERARDIVERLTGTGVDQVAARVVAALDGLAVGQEATVREWGSTLATLGAVRATLETFRPEIFDEPLDLAVAATAPGGTRADRPGAWERRRIKAGIRRLLRPGLPPRDLHTAVVDAAAQRTAWRQLAGAGGRPEIPAELDLARAEYTALFADLQWLADRLPSAADEPSLVDEDRATLGQRLAVLAARIDRLAVLPEVRGPLDALDAAGFGPLIADFAAREIGPESVVPEAELAWWASIAVAIAEEDPRIGQHSGDQLRAVAAEYAAADRQVIEDGATRVRNAVHRRVSRVARAYPEQVARIRAAANRTSGHVALRDLLTEAGEVLTAAHPCWVMSPLVVASVLPPGRFFDVVVFDESSQIRAAVAVSAISRGQQVVLFGDPQQLPPIPNYSTVVDDHESVAADDAGVADLPSILDLLAPALPTMHLDCHYGAYDERLIAFSNNRFYDDALATFPGTDVEPVVTHHLVQGVGLVVGGGDAVASTPAEVDAVVALALEHARRRPDESLGIIAFSQPHASRIEESLRRALADADPATAAFFDESGPHPFFIKTLERVQGDERDATILAVGYGKTPHGRVLHRFGALSGDGGERRLNVAATRAHRRMSVVSSISADDLDPARLRAPGALVLRDFLAYAASEPPPHPRASSDSPQPRSGLLEDVEARIRHEGATVLTNLGSGLGQVEIAVAAADSGGRYSVAVDSDGQAYAARPPGRDRERLRTEHLERLGWRTTRVLLLDLFRDPAQEHSRVMREVDAAAGRVPEGDES